MQISPPLCGDFADPEAMAHVLDEAIVGGLRIYPTQVEALRRQGDDCPDSVLAPVPRVMRVLAERIAACPEPELPYLLGGYANPIRNRRTLGLG